MIIRDCDTIYQKLFTKEGMPIKASRRIHRFAGALMNITLSSFVNFRRVATASTRWSTVSEKRASTAPAGARTTATAGT